VRCGFALLLLSVVSSALFSALPSALAQQPAVVAGTADGASVTATPDASASVAAEPTAINAPEPQSSAGASSASDSTQPQQSQVVPVQLEPLDVKYIQPGMKAQPLTAHDKRMIGFEDSYSLLNFGGMIAAAGYQQLTNGQPNYGTDRGAFGERLGAAAIRDTAQGLFTDAVFAPLLHEDPRYYVQGSQYSLVHRALYAATRPLITCTDNGHRTLNGALLLGYASAALLNNAYYPSINRNVHDNVTAFGGSVGGAALGFVFTEFTSSLWRKVHFEQKHLAE
jgi:hypothetical protein